MRCGLCNVDLNENAARCPLCGAPARDVPPLIDGIAFQDYPAYGRSRPPRVNPRRGDPLRRSRGMTFGEGLRARFHL